MAELPDKAPRKKQGRKAIVAGGTTDGPADLVTAEIVSPTCKVCKSPYRREIDSCLVMGWSYANVRRHFNQLIEDPAEQFRPQNIATHAKKHLRSMDAAVRKIWEERARQMGLDVARAENFILTEEGVFDTLIYEGMKQVRKGSVNVEARDVLQAVQQRDKRRAEQNEIAVDAIIAEFKEFMAAIKDAHEEYLVPGRVITEKSNDELNALGFEHFARRMDLKQTKVMSGAIEPQGVLPPGDLDEDEPEDADFEEVTE